MNGRSSPHLQSPTENTVLKTATFKELSPEQKSHRQYAQINMPFSKPEAPAGLIEEVLRLDLFINKDVINFSEIQIEKVNEERVLFLQDHKVEYWYFIIEGSVKLSYNPLKFPLASAELQELIQFFDYSKIRESPQLSFTFCKSGNQSPPIKSISQSPRQLQEIQNGLLEENYKEVEKVPDLEAITQVDSKKKWDIKPKKEFPQKNSQNLIVKHLGAGDIISFKELKYYCTAGIGSKGSSVLKIGISQVNNLKINQLWQNYLHDYQEDQQQGASYFPSSMGFKTEFEENFNEYIEKYKFIKSIPLFQHITADIIDQSFNLVNYKQGDILYKEQEIAQFVYIVFEGEVELLKQTNPSNSPTMSRSPSLSPKKNFSSPLKQNTYIKASILTPGNIFGEEEITLQSLRNFSARASSKRLQVYQLSIFFFLDCLCRQNDQLLEKLKLKMQNKQQWRNNQINSIQKVQKKLSQIESQSKSNIDLLNNSSINDITLNNSDFNLNLKVNPLSLVQSAQNSPIRRQQRAQSHLRMDITPLKNHPKMAANPFLLPQIFDSNSNEDRKQLMYDDTQVNGNKKFKSRNNGEKRISRNSMDQEENRIKKDVQRKQNIINMFKKNNSIAINNKFPSFEKPLIPVDGFGLAVRTKNKYLISNSKQQSRNPSQPSIDYSSMDYNSNVDTINSKLRNKIIQNNSNLNLSLNSQPSNRNFERLMSDIDLEVQRDQIRISQIMNPIQKQLTSISQNAQQIPYINFTNNSRAISRNSIQQLNKEQNRSMDDIYSQIEKSIPISKLNTNVNDHGNSRINSFRNPFLDEIQYQDTSLRNSVIELSPTQIGTEIDRNFKINSKLGAYFRPSRSYLMNKLELKEKFSKGQKLQKLQSQHDVGNHNQMQDSLSIPPKDLKSIYQSLEKYRLLEKSPSKEYSKRKSEGYNLAIRDKIENYLNGQIGTLSTNYKLIKEPQSAQTIQPQSLDLVGMISRNSPTNPSRIQQNEMTNNIKINLSSNNFGVQQNMNYQIPQSDEVIKTRSARYQQQNELKQRYSSNNNQAQSNCQKNSTCECRFCIPHYKQQSSNSQLRYQLQEGGCSLQYTNKKNQILKKATQLIYQNSPQSDYHFKK